jgi:hypothetical protein
VVEGAGGKDKKHKVRVVEDLKRVTADDAQRGEKDEGEGDPRQDADADAGVFEHDLELVG